MTEDMLMNVVEYLAKSDCKSLRETCAYVNAETKNKVGYLRLNETYSREYTMNPVFREEVLRSVANPKEQISLKIEGLAKAYTLWEQTQRIEVLKNVHGVHVYWSWSSKRCHDIFVLKKQKEDDMDTAFYLSPPMGLCGIIHVSSPFFDLGRNNGQWYIKFPHCMWSCAM
jgi:hypothetical protein